MFNASTLILDSDSEFARRIGTAGHSVLYAATSGEAQDWIKRKKKVISRFLIEARLAAPAGLPLLRQILEINPQASVWLMAEKLEPQSRLMGRRLGFQSVFSRCEVADNIDFWFNRLEVGDGPMLEDDSIVAVESQDTMPVLPVQLGHGDRLRFSLFLKIHHRYRRICRANERIPSLVLASFVDEELYVARAAVEAQKLIVSRVERELLAKHNTSWQQQFTRWSGRPLEF